MYNFTFVSSEAITSSVHTLLLLMFAQRDTGIIKMLSILRLLNLFQWFSAWCKANIINLNIKKTKDMIIEFGEKAVVISLLIFDQWIGTTTGNKFIFFNNSVKKSLISVFRNFYHTLWKILLYSPLLLLVGLWGFFLWVFFFVLLLFWHSGLSMNTIKVFERVINTMDKVKDKMCL